MKINKDVLKALETKNVELAITTLFHNAYGYTTTDNIFDIIIEGFNCGCGTYSDEDEVLFKKVFYYAAENRTEKFKDVIFHEYFEGEDRMAEMMMSILGSFDLVEHGSSIRYPWLSETGKVLYDALKEIERLEEEYKKENEWYEVECGFATIIENPYREKFFKQ